MPTKATPTALCTRPPHEDHDSELDALAAAFSAATDPARRDALLDDVCRLALPLADAIALRYRGRGIETEDLQQVARTALVRAITRYRPGAGCGFAAYAAPSISGEVKRWFRDHGWSVRPPRRLQELRATVSSQEEVLRHVLGREPSMAEVAAALTADEDDVAEAKRCSAGYHAASLDVPTPTGGTVGESLLVVDDPFEAVDVGDALARALQLLSPRQRQVLDLRYVQDLTQSEIGDRIGVSQMQVSRILRTTLAALRAELCRDGIDAGSPAA